jgi:uncharacterized protein YegJ (DUF2314 family)
MGLRDRLGSLIRRKKDEDDPPHANVLYLRKPVRLTNAEIVARTSRTLGVDMSAKDGSATDNFVVGDSVPFMVKAAGLFFMILSAPQPYWPRETSERAPELRLRKALLEHRAWIAVELMGPSDKATMARATAYHAKITSALADDNCLALGFLHLNQWRVYDQSIATALREGRLQTDQLLPDEIPVTEISRDDPRMKAAVAEARARLPEFVNAFEAKNGAPDGLFSIKAPITRGGNTEFIWVNVKSIERNGFRGEIGNEPVDLPGLMFGSRVFVPIDDLNDWMYNDGDDLRGGFTVKVLMDSRR